MIESTGDSVDGGSNLGQLRANVDLDIIPDMLPSVDQISLINTPDPSPEVDAAIGGCDKVLKDVTSIVQADINKHIGDSTTHLESFHAAILGDIEADLANVASVIAKCDQRIGKQLSDEFGKAWDFAFGAGVQPPSELQIEAALAGLPIPDAEPADSLLPTETAIKAIPGIGAVDPITLQPVIPPQPVVPPPDFPPEAGQQNGNCPPPFKVDNNDGSSTYYWWTPIVNAGGNQVGCQIHGRSTPADPSKVGGGGGGGVGGGGGGGGGDIPEPPISTNGDIPPEQQQPNSDCPPCDDDSSDEEDKPEPTPIEPLKGTAGQIPCGPYMAESFAAAVDKMRPEGIQDTTNGQFTCQPGVANWLSEWGKYVFTAGIAGSKPDFGPAWQNTNNCFNNWVFENIIKPWWPTGDCDVFKSTVIAAEGIIPRFIDQWFGVVPKQITTTLDYSANFSCQYLIPTGGDLLTANVKGFITDDEWRFGTKLLGLCIPWQEKIRESAYQRIGVRDAYRLNKLGLITDEEYTEAWKRNGINLEQDQFKFEEAQKQYPGMSDLIRMMVRDVEDSRVVDELGLDEEFEDKWTGELKQWGESQGVSDSIARKYWRAHWQQPAPGTIFEWLHRLRPDDRWPDDKFRDTVVDEDFAKELLKIADYVPGSIDAYIATSYRPYSRLDIRRMYRSGILDSVDSLRKAYRDLGSDEAHAQNLAEFTAKTEAPAKAKLLGVMPAVEVLKGYQEGIISEKETRDVLEKNGLDDDQIAQMIATADDRRTITGRKKAVGFIKKRYFMGEFSDAELRTQLTSAGVPDNSVAEIVRIMRLERDSRRKEPTIAMLCTWFDKGLIKLDKYMERVRNLGWNEADALLVVEACQVGIRERQFKELEKEQQRQLKAQQAENKAKAKALRDAAAHRRLTHTVSRKDGKVTTTDADTTTQQVS